MASLHTNERVIDLRALIQLFGDVYNLLLTHFSVFGQSARSKSSVISALNLDNDGSACLLPVFIIFLAFLNLLLIEMKI